MYRWATDKDKEAVMELWSMEFAHYEPYFSWYFNQIYRPERTLCNFEGKRLAACVQLLPFTISVGGEPVPASYLTGLITHPGFRCQGRGQELLEKSCYHMQEEGHSFIFLATDIPEYYSSSGYRHYYQRAVLNLPPGNVPAAILKPTGDLTAHIPALQEIYQAMTRHYDGYIIRGEREWRSFLEEQACDKAQLLLVPGRFYVLYLLRRQVFTIVELGFYDEPACAEAVEAAQGAAQAAGKEIISWYGPINGPELLPELPDNYWQQAPYVMAKILDERAAALSRPGTKPLWINDFC